MCCYFSFKCFAYLLLAIISFILFFAQMTLYQVYEDDTVHTISASNGRAGFHEYFKWTYLIGLIATYYIIWCIGCQNSVYMLITECIYLQNAELERQSEEIRQMRLETELRIQRDIQEQEQNNPQIITNVTSNDPLENV